jgi:hypothetical protein
LPCPSSRRPLSLRSLAPFAAALAIAGCGGGVFLGFNFGDIDGDGAPSVSLAVTPVSAAPGGAVRLVAAASDASGIDSVQFFRLDGDVAVSLGADGNEPFEWATALPADAAGSVRFFARATDGVGQRADSNVVSVSVVP